MTDSFLFRKHYFFTLQTFQFHLFEAMDEYFKPIAERATRLRLTEIELIALVYPHLPYVTYWRAKTGVTSAISARVKVLRRVEQTLDRLEVERGAALN